MKMNKKQIFARFGDVDDRFIDESTLPEKAAAERPGRRFSLAAFFEKPAVVAAICAIFAMGALAGIIAAGRAAGDPTVPPGSTLEGSENTETQPSELSPLLRHGDLYYISHGNGTCSLVGIAALPEDKVLTIPETAVNGERVISLHDMTMTSSVAVFDQMPLSQIKEIHLPASMTSVHINTLHEMTALTALTVDEENPVYRAEKNCLIERDKERLVYSYAECLQITSSSSSLNTQPPFLYFYIPNSVKIIASGALNHIVSVDTLKKIGAHISHLDIQIPASVEYIEERFFSNHDYLPVKLRVDEKNQFYYTEENCLIRKDSNTVIWGGKNAKIPDSVTAIAPYAFEGTGLTSIHIPASVEYIGELAFWNNPHLESITGDHVAMPKVDIDTTHDGVFSCYYVTDHCLVLGEIRVTDGEITRSDTLVLGCANSRIPENIDAIGDYAFAWNKGITEIDLPTDLQSIGFKAFAHCPNLMTIRYHNTYARWCQVAVDDTWMYDNGQLAELHFSDADIPMIVVGVEFDYSGKGATES